MEKSYPLLSIKKNLDEAESWLQMAETEIMDEGFERDEQDETINEALSKFPHIFKALEEIRLSLASETEAEQKQYAKDEAQTGA